MIISSKTHYILIIEGVFRDGSTISSSCPENCISSEKFEKQSLDQRITAINNAITTDTLMKHSAIFEQLHDNNLKPDLVRYYFQKIKKHTSQKNREWLSYFEKIFICVRTVPKRR